MTCGCNSETRFRGNEVRDKVNRDGLKKIAYGPNFGDILYQCPSCGQWWEENLSEASNKDWPPILIKLTGSEVESKYGDRASMK